MLTLSNYSKVLLVVSFAIILAHSSYAQSTEFTYQGRLLFSGSPANGSHDFEFRLFTDADGNSQVGPSIPLSAVNVNNGVFSVRLDFGNQFPGANRFLEIRVRQTGDPAFNLLAPRQAITSAPYSIKSLNTENAANAVNTTQLGGIEANQYVLTIDARLSDARNPLPNSPSYIQNTTSVQPTSNFNVSGTGTANVFNAAAQYSIGGQRVLSVVGGNNTLAGFGAGAAHTTGSFNSFFGTNAGLNNTTGFSNSFFGQSAGRLNTSGFNNSFFGYSAGNDNTGSSNTFVGSLAGLRNTTAAGNTFVGKSAGEANTTGNLNSFLGTNAGAANTTGFANSFFGREAGASNTTAINNSFFGQAAGFKNTTGHDNTFIGNGAGFNNTTADNNTIVGSLAGFSNTAGLSNSFFGKGAGQSNTIGSGNSFFGNGAGSANTTSSFNSYFGNVAGLNTTGLDNSFFGAVTGIQNTTGSANSFFGRSAGSSNTIGDGNVFIGVSAGNANTVGSGNTIIGANADVASNNLTFATAIGANAVVTTSSTVVLGRSADSVFVPGSFRFAGLGSGGAQPLCRNNTTNQVSFCSSSLRYKKNIASYSSGLETIERLHPISFEWKDTNARDLGFAAEDVAKVEPLLVTYNDSGEVEGVKYDRIAVVLINALKEQQARIESQHRQIEALTKIVCAQNAHAGICKEERK